MFQIPIIAIGLMLGAWLSYYPSDLTVTARILGFKKAVDANGAYYLPYARIVLCNSTAQPREVAMMCCSWEDSWLAANKQGLFVPTYSPGCDHNFLNIFSIPARNSIVFNAPLRAMRGQPIAAGQQRKAQRFKLGFVDLLTEAKKNSVLWYEAELIVRDTWHHAPGRSAATIYWTNNLTTAFDPDSVRELATDSLKLGYQLPKARE